MTQVIKATTKGKKVNIVNSKVAAIIEADEGTTVVLDNGAAFDVDESFRSVRSRLIGSNSDSED